MQINSFKKEDLLEGSIILIDKPIGYSSFGVVNEIRKAVCQKLGVKKLKVGHAGTLDPLASGLLILATGKMTKQIDGLQAQIKEYTGNIVLGAYTPSYDLETEVSETMPTDNITNEMVSSVANSFVGKQLQTPPVFSAKKIDGKRAYESAREGIEIEMKANEIEIFDMKVSTEIFPEIMFTVSCSKGTYIRSLAYDFGKKLNNIAYLKNLRRTKSGSFSVENALTPSTWIQSFTDALKVK